MRFVGTQRQSEPYGKEKNTLSLTGYEARLAQS